MTDRYWTPLALRDLHLDLAVTFEAEAFTADDSFDMEYFAEKAREAFHGAEYFEDLYLKGISEVSRAQP